MKVVTASPGWRGVDSYPFSIGGTEKQANDLAANGIDFVVGYLGCINRDRLSYILDAGMAFSAVTLASRYDGNQAVGQAKALILPAGATIWLDLEGMATFNTPIPELIKRVKKWSDVVNGEGYIPGLYVGAPQPFNSEELYSLKSVRYWKGIGRTVDHSGNLAEPKCGWSMIQVNPSVRWRNTGVFVDVNIVCQDYMKRLPTMVTI